MTWRVGIDIGGTFTDVAAADLESGEVHLRKVASTPAEIAESAVSGLAALGTSLSIEAVGFLAHGTTVGTNALLEGTGARTGVVTTEGFRDLLEIARQQRPALYDFRARKPRPLAPRWLRREVAERMRYDGRILRELDLAQARRELEALRAEGVESLAICFLHSYVNPAHERAVRELAREMLPGVYVTASSDLLPRFREYERLSTTVVNAYLGPLMASYLNELETRFAAAGVRVAPQIMQSNGGIVPVSEARAKPATTVLSGPAAGASAAAVLCSQLGIESAVSMDMGGTSTDLSLIEGGTPSTGTGREVGGYAIELSGVDVRCIGAGGGSIVSVDAAGLPRVGPRSAGAHPGPVCYGRGGTEPTLTDAFVALGRIGPSGLVGGQMALDVTAAQGIVRERVAEPLDVGIDRAALGVVELAVANVRRAVEAMTVAQGHDPRRMALVSAGGAGPVLGCEVAAELGMPEVIVPKWPGSFSACGLLTADVRRDWVRTQLLQTSEETLGEFAEAFADLESEAEGWLTEALPAKSGRQTARGVAARYVGQDYELEVPVRAGAINAETLAGIVRGFHREHEARYGYALPDRAVEVVDVSVTAVGRMPQPPEMGPPRTLVEQAGDGEARPVYVGEGGRRECPVLGRWTLVRGDAVAGPAIIEQYDSTTYVAPGWTCEVDEYGNLHMKAAGQ